MIKSLKLITIISSSLLLGFVAQASAKECKGMNQTSCASAATCTWVSGYKTKADVSVAGYCRNKMSKKETDVKKAVSDKTDKVKSVKDDAKTKAKAAKDDAKAKAKEDKVKAVKDDTKTKAKADKVKAAKDDAKAKADKVKTTISK